LAQIRALASDATRLQEMAEAGEDDERPNGIGEAVGADRLRLVLDPAWDELPTAEQSAIVRGWVAKVDFDGVKQKVTIHFCRQGVLALVGQEELW